MLVRAALTPSRPMTSTKPDLMQSMIAQRLRTILSGSDILNDHVDCDRLQDAYSFRCAPQVHGAVYESFNDWKTCSALS